MITDKDLCKDCNTKIACREGECLGCVVKELELSLIRVNDLEKAIVEFVQVWDVKKPRHPWLYYIHDLVVDLRNPPGKAMAALWHISEEIEKRRGRISLPSGYVPDIPDPDPKPKDYCSICKKEENSVLLYACCECRELACEKHGYFLMYLGLDDNHLALSGRIPSDFVCSSCKNSLVREIEE